MIFYYLTEMNLIKLENTIMRFIINNNVNQQLRNGLVTKLSQLMYDKHIDYYYPDYIATSLNVDIRHVDQVYLYGHANLYQKPLCQLLNNCQLYDGDIKDADKLEQDIRLILERRKPILVKKYKKQAG